MSKPSQEYLATLTANTRKYISELEALVRKNAADIERLRDAINRHRSNIWGSDGKVWHAEDKDLYDALEGGGKR